MDPIGEASKALLEEEEQQRLVEGCPGCKCAYLRRHGAPLPKEILFTVANLMLCTTLPIQILFPYLYFMVEDFHIANSENIGYYAGAIGSAFMVGRTVSSVPWGILADKYGRKPVIFCGMASMVVFNTWFGLSKLFWTALASRLLLGAFCGLYGILNAYAAEICSDEYRPVSLSLISTMWGLGLVIGPSIGGYLSQPGDKYPKVFKYTLFDWFPYLLPPFVVSAYALILLFSLFRLPETLHKHERSDNLSQYKPGGRSLMKNYPFLSSNIIYCVWAFHDIAYNETFSLWAVSPGGLRWTSQDVGLVLAITGLCLLGFQLTVFPVVAKMFGPILVARTTALLAVPLLAVYPFLPGLHGTTCFVFVTFVSVLKSCLSAATVTSCFLLVNNSVTQGERGTANGISAGLVSLARALGPLVGGCVFSWAQSQKEGALLPGNQLLFFFLAVIALIAIIATFEPILPRSTNKPMSEGDEAEAF